MQLGTTSNVNDNKNLSEDNVFRDRPAVTYTKSGGVEIPTGHEILTVIIF